MTLRLWPLLALAPLLMGGCGGPAAEPASDPSAPFDVAALVDLLGAAGLDAVAFDAHSFIVKRDGLQVPVFLEDDGASLQAIYPFTGVPGRASAAAVARWNATRRFGRAYLDEDGLPVLASDLLLGPDVGPGAVVIWSRLMLDMAVRFRAEVWPSLLPDTEPVNE